MESEVVKNVIEKAKRYLDISGDIELLDLAQKLRAYRNSLHPDKYLDEAAKKAVEEKFKDVGSILKNLQNTIEQGSTQKSSTEMTVYSQKFDLFLAESACDQANERIRELESRIDTLQSIREYEKETNEGLKRTWKQSGLSK
jgi:cell fate (sporulation/competence/biofilm development) regulator YmcA (YheA/YmcA/DUF963 family)